MVLEYFCSLSDDLQQNWMQLRTLSKMFDYDIMFLLCEVHFHLEGESSNNLNATVHCKICDIKWSLFPLLLLYFV